MQIGYDFENRALDTKDVFGLVSLCFEILDVYIDNQSNFIGKYVSPSQNGTGNPNLEKLNKFAEGIIERFKDYTYTNYEIYKREILTEIANMELIKYEDEKLNKLTIIFIIISSIDCAAMGWKREALGSVLGPVPESDSCKLNYAVYLCGGKSIIDETVNDIGRERVKDSTFYDYFTCFRFIKKDNWIRNAELPQIKSINRDINLGGILKIASIQAAKKDYFEFISSYGALVYPKYDEELQKIIGERLIKKIEKAVMEGANIIVLPEYTVSPEMLKDIKRHLSMWSIKGIYDMSGLMAVFAGSTWENGNNIMHILDHWGNEIGKYYKYSNYRDGEGGIHGFRNCEALENPGKKCTIINVTNIGSFLPSICRDAIDNYTYNIVKLLLPTFVIISAWSRSVNSFKKNMDEYAKKQFASALLCNGCNSVSDNSSLIGFGTIICKEGTVAGVEYCNLERKELCSHSCTEGCVFMVSYNFSIYKNNSVESIRSDKL